MILLCSLFSVYILAINFYAFCSIRAMRDEEQKNDKKLLLLSAMGGAATLFAAMLLLRYRTGSMFLMIVLPLLAVINVYCAYLGFQGILLLR